MTYIDTRDLAAELEQLESLDELDPTETERKAQLIELHDAVGDEWPYGALLIPEADFEDYARELAEDIGAVDPNAGWPLKYIDWEAAANALRIDYTDVTFDGTDYLFRA